MAGWALYNTYLQNPEYRRSHILGGFISNNLKNERNTYYYADVNNTAGQIEKFRAMGAENEQIIIDPVHARLPRRENYQRLKNEMLQPGDIIVICSLSVLGSKYAARPELIYYRDHHIRVKVLDMPATMQEFPEGSGNIYDIVTDAVIQTLTTVIRQEQLRIKRQQRRGIGNPERIHRLGGLWTPSSYPAGQLHRGHGPMADGQHHGKRRYGSDGAEKNHILQAG